MRPLRRVAVGFAILAVVVVVRWQWHRLTGPQTPPPLFDSYQYMEIVAQPLGPRLMFSAKPLTVPLFFRALGADPPLIARIQGELAFAAWAVVTAVLVLALRRRWAKLIAGGIGIAFLLAAPRVGWSGVLLSESLADTLMALIAAGAIGLAVTARTPWSRARIAIAVATGALGVAWMFARDTNAIAALVAVAVATLIWPVRRWWTTGRWGIGLAGVATAAALVALWSTRVPAPLPSQQHWYVPLTMRGGYPLLDNMLARVLPSDRAWLAERGAPVDVLAQFAGPEITPERLVYRKPELAPTQVWLEDHGPATYLRWLARHPVARIGELIGARWTVLAARYPTTMPVGWIAPGGANPVVEAVRRLTTTRWLLLALIAASPLLLWRSRAAPLTGVALCMVASGVVAAAASYYGDSAELARHCYGAGQLIVLGLFIGLVAWLDGVRAGAPADQDRTRSTRA